MVYIEVKLAAGCFSEGEKEQLAAALTDAVVGVARSEAFRELVWVVVEDADRRGWHIGGQTFRDSRDLVQALRRAKESFDSISGIPTTRKDLAASAPIRTDPRP